VGGCGRAAADIVAGDMTAQEASSAGLDTGGWEPVTVRLREERCAVEIGPRIRGAAGHGAQAASVRAGGRLNTSITVNNNKDRNSVEERI
jgi:hypothetical protein